MLYTRSWIVNFRFSEEEFDLLKARCDEHGARSLSDYVRDVMLRTLKAGESPADADDGASSLERRLSRMERKLSRLEESLHFLESALLQQIALQNRSND
jgi:hypothetical protein